MKRVVRVLAAVAAATALASCSHDGRTLRPAGPDQTLSIASSSTTVAATTAPAKNAGADTAGLTVTAPWPDNGIIDAKYTCKGVGVSPAISWSGVPAKTKELALSLVDLDANDFVHWVVAGLDPASTGIVEGKVPAGATQAINGFGKAGWNGPCPPDGQHTYLLTLYALPAPSGVKSTMQGTAAITSLDAHKIASVAMTGLFGVTGEPSIRAARFSDLDAATLYGLLRLRGDVFVVEQACAYPDLDGRDTEATTIHCWIDVDGAPAAVLRLLAEPDGAAGVGRVATAAPHRGKGLADALVRHAVSLAGAAPVVLDAQSYLVDWYRVLGFVVDGPEFVEDGIPHMPMRLAR